MLINSVSQGAHLEAAPVLRRLIDRHLLEVLNQIGGPRQVGEDQTRALAQPIDAPRQVGPADLPRSDGPAQFGEVVVECGRGRQREADGRVDLVRHARHELAERGELLGLNQLRLGGAQFGQGGLRALLLDLQFPRGPELAPRAKLPCPDSVERERVGRADLGIVHEGQAGIVVRRDGLEQGKAGPGQDGEHSERGDPQRQQRRDEQDHHDQPRCAMIEARPQEDVDQAEHAARHDAVDEVDPFRERPGVRPAEQEGRRHQDQDGDGEPQRGGHGPGIGTENPVHGRE
ncbi:hypothetical protein M2440_004469 [Methylorubrum extorquens]|nr:hypothetical protein [Methylorubrum extorquens]